MSPSGSLAVAEHAMVSLSARVEESRLRDVISGAWLLMVREVLNEPDSPAGSVAVTVHSMVSCGAARAEVRIKLCVLAMIVFWSVLTH